jgi:tetratricopeptide (TPR) repeat protein
MDLDWTDHKNASSETFQETKISLLSEECLNGMLRLLERMKSEGRFKCDNQEVEEQTLSLQFDPHTDETGFFELGHLYFQTKQYELAAEIFETVIKCECSLSKLAIEFLFDCLYELGDRGKELAERSILMSIAPDLAQIIINNSVKSPSD